MVEVKEKHLEYTRKGKKKIKKLNKEQMDTCELCKNLFPNKSCIGCDYLDEVGNKMIEVFNKYGK